MINKKSILVFPTSRAIRDYLSKKRSENTLLPTLLTIDEFFKKVIYFENRTYLLEEQKVLFLNEAIENINIAKLGINSSFAKFLTQSDYIYSFFQELASENIEISTIKSFDTYEFYAEHLEILQNILDRYLEILDKNSCVDRINLKQYYKINEKFLEKFDEVNIFFEGYFTKQEFEIVEKISTKIDLNIEFYSKTYNQKSLKVFQDFNLKLNKKYSINLSSKKTNFEEDIKSDLKNLKICGFSSRINQIAFIKSSISEALNSGLNASKIVVVLPDESFTNYLEMFDSENYFNFAMGKSIKNRILYQKLIAVFEYISEDDDKSNENLKYLELEKELVDEKFKKFWNNICTLIKFKDIKEFLLEFENDTEVKEKIEEIFFKLEIILFSNDNKLKLKDIYKIIIQKINEISIDDINSGKITVMGLLETRKIEFDAVIIVDFNDSKVPKISLKDKFLSSKIKEKSNLPTRKDREDLQKYYYERLVESSKNVFVSYVNSSSEQISRFANELFKQKIVVKSFDEEYKDILYTNKHLKYEEKDIKLKLNLQNISWSASSLKRFLDCKRKYYFENIAKIKNHHFSKKPENFELGQIIHKILEELFIEFDFSQNAIENAFIKYKNENPYLILDLEIWKKRIYQFFEKEEERLKNRQIISLEEKFETDFNGFKINGVIDRVDKFDDFYELYDYKTSSSLSVDTIKNYENSTDFQLEFYYIYILSKFQTQNIKPFYIDLYRNEILEETVLNEKLELLRVKFDELKSIQNNEIEFNKTTNMQTCTYCNYKIICNR